MATTTRVRRAPAETRDVEVPFTLVRSTDSDNDGQTFEGYAAVFNSRTHIRDEDGEYDEVIAPGAFKRSIDRSTPVLMFNHGKHPLLGSMPLGKITELREDARGLYVKARLTDNWLIQPVRDAIRDEAVTGMSFRFEVVKDQVTGVGPQKLRTLKEVKVPELGPVVMPAYSDTSAMVRSSMRSLAQFSTEDRAGDNDDWSVTQMVENALETLLGINDQTQDVYTIEVVGNRITFVVTNPTDASQSGLWQADFTYTDGTVAVTAPQPVQPVEYAPRSIEPEGETRAKYDAATLRKMAANGQAMPDGSYPIGDKEDLSNAIHAVGRGSGSHNAIRQHIIKRAKALGASDMIPSNWNSDGSMSGSNSQAEGTSEELAATVGPSEELATETRTFDASNLADRRRYARQIMAARRAS